MRGKKKYYLTKEGLKKIKKEYQKLLKTKKAVLQKEAPPFLHSEELNTEFIAFKENSDYLNSRLEELDYIFNNYEIIKKPGSQEERKKVNLGAKVLIEINNQEDEFMIVGTLEADPSAGKISNESPVGRALLGHKEGDEISISAPASLTYKIKKISY